MFSQLRSLSTLKLFQQNVSALDVESDQFTSIVNAALARLSPYILEAADIILAHFMSRVAYLAPLRVSAERVYRIQNLAVDELEPAGENLAMFLRSLSPTESESFASFTRSSLGFTTSVRTTGMHAEILVKSSKARRFFNLIDVGFGYSEVLPLAAILWASCIRPTMENREPAPLVAIEQPELHLHPAHQADLARMLVEAVSKGGGAKILVETHSESLINGLGKLIYEGAIKADDVQIVLFDQDEETEQTTVKLAGYRENGALHDWPYGFLSPAAGRRNTRAAAE
jgi:predicted ATPase